MDDLSAVFFGTTAGLSDSSVRDTSMRVPRLGLKSERTIRWDEIEQSIPDRFEDVVRRYPDHCAVKAGVKAFTYDELNRAANRIAHAIIAHRGESSEPIALLFENGFEGIAAFFGALKARKSAVIDSDRSQRSIRIRPSSVKIAIRLSGKGLSASTSGGSMGIGS